PYHGRVVVPRRGLLDDVHAAATAVLNHRDVRVAARHVHVAGVDALVRQLLAGQRPREDSAVLDAKLDLIVDVTAPVQHRAVAVASAVAAVAVVTTIAISAVVVIRIVPSTASAWPTDVFAVGVAFPVADEVIRVRSAARVLNADDRREAVLRVRLLNHGDVSATLHYLDANNAVLPRQVAHRAASREVRLGRPDLLRP